MLLIPKAEKGAQKPESPGMCGITEELLGAAVTTSLLWTSQGQTWGGTQASLLSLDSHSSMHTFDECNRPGRTGDSGKCSFHAVQKRAEQGEI